jgi:hypothetical protein
VLGYRGGGGPTPTTAAQPTTTAPPVTFAIAATAARPGAYAAAIEWTTTEPSTARLQWGPDGATPVLWSTESVLSRRHVVQLRGLAALASYEVTIDAATPFGDTDRTTLSFTTAAAPAAPTATTRDGVVLVDGEPFFPVIVWQQCTDQLPASLAAGVDLYAGSQCISLDDFRNELHGRGLVAGAEGSTATGAIGSFYPDEADARGYTGATLPGLPAGLRFLTITSHFFSGAAPLPAGREMYPSLVEAADVVGFDLYPLQELCRPDMLPAVYDAQRELELLAPGKPTFQWIETRTMKCGDAAPVTVTPQTIRAESWLSIAGGATALAYFPPDWQRGSDRVVAGVVRRLRQLGPALLEPMLPVTVVGSAVTRASARTYGEAVYVIAVNAGLTPADVTLSLPALGDRTLLVLGGPARRAAGGVITDRLPPLAVRIYVAPPA